MLVMKHVSNDHKHHGRHKIEAIDLVIRKGEILGIAGVEGNGQKELAEGHHRYSEEENAVRLFWMDRIWQEMTIRERYEAGISYISEDRLSDSLITGMNIIDNLLAQRL